MTPSHTQTKTVLFIEDDEAGRELGCYNLRKAGYQVEAAVDGAEGLDLFSPDRHGLVITDLKMPKVSGMEVLEEIKRVSPQTPVIVVTAYGNVDLAVAAMKAGAYDFVGKPFNRDHLVLVVRKALETSQLQKEIRELRIKAGGVERGIVYVSGAMSELLDTADRVARSDASVLITGESGTGKELVARRIHVRSSRAERTFVAINCAAMPAELLESELFGHEKGAFTGAIRARPGKFRQADGGTLFLDEIGELPFSLQSKLLRVLQERVVDVIGKDQPVPVDVRLVAATNQDLQRRVMEGGFREDLYYRLNVVELRVPPLRERPEDIPPLVAHFVERFSEGRDLEMPDSLLNAMQARQWPGNVRELENACERLVILARGDTLSEKDLPRHSPMSGRPDNAQATSATDDSGPGEDSAASTDTGLDGWPALPPDGLSLVELERTVIERVLDLKGWNISQAARYLRIPRHILTYRMKKYGFRRS